MKTKVILKGKYDAIHEYNIKEKIKKNGHTVYELWYSKNSDVWCSNIIGTKILTCIDNGFNREFKFEDEYDFKKLEYDESFHMYLILHYIEKQQKFSKVKFK